MADTEKQDVDNDAPDPAAWLPKCYFGSVDTPLPHPSEDTSEDPDDELLAVTPPDVIWMLGFVPRELDNEDEDDKIPNPMLP